jgi:hypothetical protein
MADGGSARTIRHMTNVLSDGTAPTASGTTSRFDDKSLLGLGAGLIAALLTGALCSWAKLPESVTGSVTAIAVAVPAALDLHLKSRRRDQAADAERVRRGMLRRPVGLVVAVLAAAILLADTLMGMAVGAYVDLVGRDVISSDLAAILGPVFSSLPAAVLGVGVFLSAGYASHYCGRHPYRWVAAAVGCCLLLRTVIVSLWWEGPVAEMMGVSLRTALWMAAVYHLGLFALAMSGVWYGRRHHNEFLARELARLESCAQ